MGQKLAVDFGTTNSILARWNDQSDQAEILAIPGLSSGQEGNRRPLIPSLLYIQDGQAEQVIIGQAVLDRGLDRQRSNRLFRGFKRSITAQTLLEPRLVDGVSWTDQDAGRHFLHLLLHSLPFPPKEIERLAVTVPVTSFESYTAWLSEALPQDLVGRIRLVDESTAAALGYAVTKPGEVVLVVDLGGGTLDLSLVQLPESPDKTGAWLGRLFSGRRRQHAARVIAKAGASLGGSDIDQWLLAEVLARAGLSIEELGQGYAPLLAACEQAKIALSTAQATTVEFETGGGRYCNLPFRRAELEDLMARKGFFTGLRQAVDQTLSVAHRRGIYREDIHHVLLVGGVALTPAVQQLLRDIFSDKAVRVDRPFTAVAEGALQVAIGHGLEDFLVHSYGLRYLDLETCTHGYDEVIPEGSRYPLHKPVEIVLGAVFPQQSAMEFVVAQIDNGAVSMVEVQYQDGQAVFVAQADQNEQKIRFLNLAEAKTVPLDPPGQPGEDRLRATFTVDEQRRLRLTVTDLKTKNRLLRDSVVATLGEGEDDDVESSVERQVSGREPCLSAYTRPGRVRLSLRGVASMLNLLPPESISLEAAAEALRSPDCTVRYSAAEMLSKRGDRDARRIMQDVLAAGTPPQRASVVRHLHRLSWFGAEPLLRQAFADPDDRVHESAIFALCKMRSREAYQLAQEILPGEGDNVRLEAAWTLKDSQDPRAVPILEIALQAQSPKVRETALESLGTIAASQALPAVRRALDDPEPNVIYAAALSLVELAGEDAFPEFVDLIKHTGGRGREAILRGFFHATNYLFLDVALSPVAGALLDALEMALADPGADTRLAVIKLLTKMNHDRAVSLLRTSYRREPESEVRARIVYYAVLLESAVGLEILSAALHSSDPHVREMAEELAVYLECKAGYEGSAGRAVGGRLPVPGIAQVTPDWLTDLLRAGGHLPQGEVVSVKESRDPPVAGGPGFLPGPVLAIDYAGNVPETAPRRLYLKVGGSSVHKLAGQRECEFYTAISPQMPVPPAVRCYDAVYDVETGDYHLLLEDVSASHRVFHPEEPVSRANGVLMLDALAKLHTYWWDHMWLGQEFGTWPTVESIEAGFDRLAGAWAGFKGFVGDRFSAEQWAIYDQALARYPVLLQQRVAHHQNLTLVHNDAHAGNFLLPRQADGQHVYLVDWQKWGIGVGPWDVAYLIALFWPAERRAEMERSLVQEYHVRLQAYGGLGYDWQTCWHDYRMGIIGNLMVPLWAWVDGTWTEDREHHCWRQVEMATRAFEDLECAELL